MDLAARVRLLIVLCLPAFCVPRGALGWCLCPAAEAGCCRPEVAASSCCEEEEPAPPADDCDDCHSIEVGPLDALAGGAAELPPTVAYAGWLARAPSLPAVAVAIGRVLGDRVPPGVRRPPGLLPGVAPLRI